VTKITGVGFVQRDGADFWARSKHRCPDLHVEEDQVELLFRTRFMRLADLLTLESFESRLFQRVAYGRRERIHRQHQNLDWLSIEQLASGF